MFPSDASIFQDFNALPAIDSTSSGSEDLLRGVMQVFSNWLEHLPVHDLRFKKLNATEILFKNILESGAYSGIYVMTTAQALLCTKCRRLDAAPEECSGRSLDRCPLLNGIGT